MSKTKLLHKESLKHTQQGFEIKCIWNPSPKRTYIFMLLTHTVYLKLIFNCPLLPALAAPSQINR